jgi:cold shock protein
MSSFDQPRRSSWRHDRERQDLSPPRLRHNRGHQSATRLPTESTLHGRVKWFSDERGFGFISLEDGTEAFLHGSILARARLTVSPGDTVRVGVGQGSKGRQVTELLKVKAATPPERSLSPGTRQFRQRLEPGLRDAAASSIRGVVKWWDGRKGFGFVTPEVGTQDIFVHASTVVRSGLSLEQGMPVRVKVRQGVKGPEAVEIALA